MSVLSNEVIAASVRALGMVAFLPFGNSIPTMGLRLMIALGLGLLGSSLGGESGSLTLLGLVSEGLIGCCLALPVLLVVETASFGAELIESGRGQTVASFFDPFVFSFEVSLSVLLRHLTWAFLVVSGILCHLVRAYFDSLTSISFSVSQDSSLWSTEILSRWGIQLFRYMGEVLQGGLTVALTFAILFFVIDMCIGFIAKVVPQANLMTEAFLVKTVASALLLMTLWNFGFAASLLVTAQAEWILK